MEVVSTLADLNYTEFEKLSCEYLHTHGFNVRRVGGAGDLGIDILGHDPQGRKVVGQCKLYRADRIVGSREIQHFYAMAIHADAERGLFFTASDYTQPARDFAQATMGQQLKIQLIDGRQIGAFYEEKLRRQSAAEPQRRENDARDRQTHASAPETSSGLDRSSLRVLASVHPSHEIPESRVERARRLAVIVICLLFAGCILVMMASAAFDWARDAL